MGSQATPLTKLVWPSRVCTLWPFAGSHMMIRLSSLHSQHHCLSHNAWTAQKCQQSCHGYGAVLQVSGTLCRI